MMIIRMILNILAMSIKTTSSIRICTTFFLVVISPVLFSCQDHLFDNDNGSSIKELVIYESSTDEHITTIRTEQSQIDLYGTKDGNGVVSDVSCIEFISNSDTVYFGISDGRIVKAIVPGKGDIDFSYSETRCLAYIYDIESGISATAQIPLSEDYKTRYINHSPAHASAVTKSSLSNKICSVLITKGEEAYDATPLLGIYNSHGEIVSHIRNGYTRFARGQYDFVYPISKLPTSETHQNIIDGLQVGINATSEAISALGQVSEIAWYLGAVGVAAAFGLAAPEIAIVSAVVAGVGLLGTTLGFVDISSFCRKNAPTWYYQENDFTNGYIQAVAYENGKYFEGNLVPISPDAAHDYAVVNIPLEPSLNLSIAPTLPKSNAYYSLAIDYEAFPLGSELSIDVKSSDGFTDRFITKVSGTDCYEYRIEGADSYEHHYIEVTAIFPNGNSLVKRIVVSFEEIEDERKALIELYKNTNGPNWDNNTNWCSSMDLNKWYGVTTNDMGNVTSLKLDSNGLQSDDTLFDLSRFPCLLSFSINNNDLGSIHIRNNNLIGKLYLNDCANDEIRFHDFKEVEIENCDGLNSLCGDCDKLIVKNCNFGESYRPFSGCMVDECLIYGCYMHSCGLDSNILRFESSTTYDTWYCTTRKRLEIVNSRASTICGGDFYDDTTIQLQNATLWRSNWDEESLVTLTCTIKGSAWDSLFER